MNTYDGGLAAGFPGLARPQQLSVAGDALSKGMRQMSVYLGSFVLVYLIISGDRFGCCFLPCFLSRSYKNARTYQRRLR